MNILHFKCSLHFKLNIVMFVLFCSGIIVPTKSVSSASPSNIQRYFICDQICGLVRFGESVINNPFIATAFCFVTEWMIEWRDAWLIKTATCRHLLVVLLLNLQVSLWFAIIYYFSYYINNTLNGMLRIRHKTWHTINKDRKQLPL